MKVIYDNNNFVIRLISYETCICDDAIEHGFICKLDHENHEILDYDDNGFNAIVILGLESPGRLFNCEYGIPLYKLVNYELVEIIDPTEYMISPIVWEHFCKMTRDEITEHLKVKTDAELKAIYDAAPEWYQNLMYDEIECFYNNMLPQKAVNLSTEIIIKTICKVLYKERVLQETLTSDETAAFYNLLTIVNNHQWVMEPYVGTYDPQTNAGWYLPYAESILTGVDNVRNLCLPKRRYICGR